MLMPRLSKKRFFNYSLERDDVFIKREKIENKIQKEQNISQELVLKKEDSPAEQSFLKDHSPQLCGFIENSSWKREENNKIKRLLKFKNKRNDNTLSSKRNSDDETPKKDVPIFNSFSNIKVKEESFDPDFDNEPSFDDVVDTDLPSNQNEDEALTKPPPSSKKRKNLINEFGKVNRKYIASDGSYFCTTCMFNTMFITHFEKHVKKTHPEMTLYICEICKLELRSKSNLNVHVMNHLGLKPFKCSLCSYATPRKTYLNLHLKSHSKKDVFNCFCCNYTTFRKDYLNRHITKNHKVGIT